MLSIIHQINPIINSVSILYIRLIPEVLDFTIDEPGVIEIYSENGFASIPFNPKSPDESFTILEHAVEDKTIIFWNFKNLATLAKFYTKEEISWASKVKDLKIIEAFLSETRKKAPNSYDEAVGRMKEALGDPSWRSLYKDVHLPLMTTTVPTMEATGLLSDVNRCILHPYYEIEGQKQGRMKAINAFAKTYNPHTLGKDPDLRPPLGEHYILFDYNNMEVSMLAWLSQDKRLQAILESGRDVYETIWMFMMDQTPTENTRRICKETFLPVIYGMGEGSLAEKFGNLEAARLVITAIHNRFPVAMSYLRTIQNSTSPNGLVRDYFGRPRIFEHGSHKIRNFVIQSPAAIVCEERLIALERSIRGSASLVFHVHDGYALTCREKEIEHIFAMSKATLETQTPLCEGLKLRVSGTVGDHLDTLRKPA